MCAGKYGSDTATATGPIAGEGILAELPGLAAFYNSIPVLVRRVVVLALLRVGPVYQPSICTEGG